LDFLKQLLIKDPEHRLSSSDALHHSFITGKNNYMYSFY